MYEVVVSVVGLALLVAVILFDCRVRVAAARPGTWHFSDRLHEADRRDGISALMMEPVSSERGS